MEISKNLLNSLKILLASEYVLYTKIWWFHWNLIGTDFAERHALYGIWKDLIGDDIDIIAERLRQLDTVSPAGLEEFFQLSVINDETSNLRNEAETATILLADMEKMCDAFYQSIEIAEWCDKVTSNILQDLASHIDKIKWFLKSICGNKSVEVIKVEVK